MRGYGLPRDDDIAHPDLADICIYGLKTGRGHPPWRHACNCKDRARRFWKKMARHKAKEEIRKEIKDLEDGSDGKRLVC